MTTAGSDNSGDSSERDTWLISYSEQLIEALAERGYSMSQDEVIAFIEQTITMIASTTGTTERDARMSITEAAVPAWAQMLENLNDLAVSQIPDDNYVAVSGALLVALRGWLHLIAPFADTEAGSEEIAALSLNLGAIEMTAANDVTSNLPPGSLEVTIDHEVYSSLIDAVTDVLDFVEDNADDLADQIESLTQNVAGGGMQPEECAEQINQIVGIGAELVEALNALHRHIGADFDDVITLPMVVRLIEVHDIEGLDDPDVG